MNHSALVSALHGRRLWLSVVSAILTVLVQGLGIVPASDQGAIYAAAAIIIGLVVTDGYVAGKHLQASAAETEASAAMTGTVAEVKAQSSTPAAPVKPVS